VYGLVAGGGGGVELFVAVGVELFEADVEVVAEGVPEVLLGVAEGLLLGVPLPVGHDGAGVGDADLVGDALADGLPLLWPELGVVDGVAEAEAGAEADTDCDGDAQLVGVPDDAVSATPEFAGITSRAPIATVPVATAPTTETAERPPVRPCLGTFQPPAFAACRAFGSCARAGAHRPTVTNLAPPGHPRAD
jgi:hypothetical protein